MDGTLMGRNIGASLVPDVGYTPLQTVTLSGAGVPTRLVSISGDYLGLVSATPFVVGADISTTDRIYVCINRLQFEEGSAVPLLPGMSIGCVQGFKSVIFALRSYPDASQPPTQNTAGVVLGFEAALGLIINRQSGIPAPVVGNPSGIPTTLYGDATNGVWVNVKSIAAGAITAAGLAPATSPTGQLSTFRNGVAGTILNTGHDIKATPGNVYGWQIRNSGAVESFVQFYNASAAATIATGLGTAVPIFTVPILNGGRIVDLAPYGIAFSSRISAFATVNFDGSGGAPVTALTGEVLFA